MKKEEKEMKKLYSVLLTTLLMIGFSSLSCTCGHVHTEECGKDGINCTHRCPIVPLRDENTPM